MNKSKLRKEYEAMFGVVDGTLRLYDTTGNEIYYEDSDGWWSKQEYDAKGNMIYRETSGGWWVNGWWVKREFDAEGNEIYYEDSRYGVGLDKRPCSGKVFIDEQSGKKFKMMEIK